MLVQAQVRENRITGHVYDSQNLPLAGVNIKVKNTPYGTVSNEKGEIVLAGKWEQGVSIEFSFIVMRRKTITYKGQTKLEVTVADDTNNTVSYTHLDVYKRQGKVRSIMPYGAFIEFLPGKDGLLHISEIDWKRLETVEEDVYKRQLPDLPIRNGRFSFLILYRNAIAPENINRYIIR